MIHVLQHSDTVGLEEYPIQGGIGDDGVVHGAPFDAWRYRSLTFTVQRPGQPRKGCSDVGVGRPLLPHMARR